MTITVPAGRALLLAAASAVSVVVPLTVAAGGDAPSRAVAQSYCAVGETEATMNLHLDRLNHGGNSFVNVSPGQTTIPVAVRRVDGLLAEHGIDPARVALVWMDIEGYEPAASRSMENLLARQVPLMTEFQSSFMGADGSAAFIDYLGRFYRDCIVFSLKGGEQTMPVSRIPIQADILDVLLLPDAAGPRG